MTKETKAASFEDFLKAPGRLAKQEQVQAKSRTKKGQKPKPQSQPRSAEKVLKASAHKEKVGLTIDSNLIDAIDDYIYHERKQGRRLKKNDVYEAALRQYLGLESGEAR